MKLQLKPFQGEKEKEEGFREVQRAILNMLEDFDTEKKRMEQVQCATLNLLEDFDAEKQALEDFQRATINILDDFDSEKTRSDQSQRAVINILDDMSLEKTKVADVNQQLATANQELEAFTYSVAHDLRAPLRHIDGFSKMLEEETQALTDEAKRFVKRIRDGARQMGQLVDDLLNLARLGRKELSLQVTGLSTLAEETVAEVKKENAGREIEWKIGALPFVECDPGLMKQVFVNLFSNAAKYSRPRQLARIEVGTIDVDGQGAIFVRDNGVGFSMKYADKLFGVFQRLHRAEDFEGTGIGLATVQRIIRKHGGRIWAEAELDKGATFYFTLGAGNIVGSRQKAEGGKETEGRNVQTVEGERKAA